MTILLNFVISLNSKALPALLWLRLVILPVTLATFTVSLLSQFQLKREVVLRFVLKNSTTNFSHTSFPKITLLF